MTICLHVLRDLDTCKQMRLQSRDELPTGSRKMRERSASFKEFYNKDFTACIKEMTSELSFELPLNIIEQMSLSVFSSSQRAVFVEQLTASKRTNVGRGEFKEAFGVDWLRF